MFIFCIIFGPPKMEKQRNECRFSTAFRFNDFSGNSTSASTKIDKISFPISFVFVACCLEEQKIDTNNYFSCLPMDMKRRYHHCHTSYLFSNMLKRFKLNDSGKVLSEIFMLEIVFKNFFYAFYSVEVSRCFCHNLLNININLFSRLLGTSSSFSFSIILHRDSSVNW